MARRDRESQRIQEAIDVFEKTLTIVRNEYEMFFMGIHPRVPSHRVRDLKRMLRDLEELPVQNTAMKFKIRQLRSKLNSYDQLWIRTMNQIENGTYRRQRFVATLREDQRQAQHDRAEEAHRQVRALARGEDEEEAAQTLTLPTAGARDVPPPKPPPVNRQGWAIGSQELLAEYAAARAASGKSGAVDPRVLEAALRQQADAIKEKMGVRDVRFRVVHEDGKAKVKAIPVR